VVTFVMLVPVLEASNTAGNGLTGFIGDVAREGTIENLRAGGSRR
jgi:hypothetical protein